MFPPTDFSTIQDAWVDIGPFLDDNLMNRETRWFYVAGRLAPFSDVAQAQKEMDVIAARLAAQYPKSNKDFGVAVAGLTDLLTANVRRPLWLIVVASNLILLLALVNILSIFLANALDRRKELSVRLALGASRSVIVRQLCVQSSIMALVATGLGLLLAKGALTYVVQKFPLAIARFRQTNLDHRVFWFTITLAIISALLSIILPGMYLTRLNINSELRDERRWIPAFRYRALGSSVLIVFEVALAMGLSLVSGLLIKSFYEVEKVDMGFNPHHILSFEIWLLEAQYGNEASKAAFYQRALNNLKIIPRVQSASAGYTLPAATGTHTINLQVDSLSPQSSEHPFVDANSVMPGFLTTMQVPLLQGRDFTDADRPDAPPVAIVDEVLAARMWPGQSAIGKRLRLADITDNRPPWREIVGVVRQIRNVGPEGPIERMQVYEPAQQNPPPFICFIMRTSASMESLRAPIEKAIHDLAPDLPLQYFQTLDEFVAKQEGGRRISLLLLSGFAAIGIVLGLIGIYAVVSNSVVRRRREMAIRMALGATTTNAMFVAARGVLVAAIVGIGAGLVVVFCLKGILSAFLFGVKSLDLEVYLLSVISIGLLALVAGLAPAARLLWLTPQSILREQ